MLNYDGIWRKITSCQWKTSLCSSSFSSFSKNEKLLLPEGFCTRLSLYYDSSTMYGSSDNKRGQYCTPTAIKSKNRVQRSIATTIPRREWVTRSMPRTLLLGQTSEFDKKDLVAVGLGSQNFEYILSVSQTVPPQHPVDSETIKDATLSLNTNTNTNSTSRQESILYTFRHPMSNITLYGHGISLPRFRSWVRYKIYNTYPSNHTLWRCDNVTNFISSRMIHASDPLVKDGLRKEWFARKLLVDRTEVLSVLSSNSDGENNVGTSSSDGSAGNIAWNLQARENVTLRKKRKLEDVLKGYVHRLMDIIQDEVNDVRHDARNKNRTKSTYRPFNLFSWLEQTYDQPSINRLLASNFHEMAITDQKESMAQLLQWFREMFPYYYDKCHHCGASYREDSTSHSTGESETCLENHNSSINAVGLLQEDDGDLLDGSFLGYCYPEINEQNGKAARTEIFRCHSCRRYTRFPRYNSVKHIVENRRGRCGEYSILLYRILRALGHEARWVVDWADHVWVECRIGGRWIHLDPCEAALDRPLLYQEWGKKQTYIIAFWIPLKLDKVNFSERYISDVTLNYTSDEATTVSERRHLDQAIVESILESNASFLKVQIHNMLK